MLNLGKDTKKYRKKHGRLRKKTYLSSTFLDSINTLYNERV